MAQTYSFEPVENDPFDAQAQDRKYVLDTIASGEAHDYNTLYGGHKFKSTKDHPNIAVPIPGTTLKSTAAGRYQLLKSTWDSEKSKLGLEDFGPEAQDAAAWNLAADTYHKNTGRDLMSDASQKSVQWGALSKQWPSLQRFVSASAAPGAAGLGAQPQVMNAEEPMIFNQLTQGGKPSQNLIPVDYDPFQGTSK